MNKTLKKNLIAASVGAVLAAGGLAAQASEIGQTNLMFPFVSSGNNAFTFITIAGRGAGLSGPMHFTYAMKAVGAANSLGCEHQDGNGTLTENDVTQFEMSNKVSVSGATLSGDVDGALPLGHWTGGANKQGFLLVNTNGLSGQTLYGEAIVIDTASGLRLAYSAQGLNTTGAADPDYTINNTGAVGGPEPAVGLAIAAPGFVGSGTHVPTWYGTAIAATQWLVEPLGLASAMTPAAAIGGVLGTYSMFNMAGTVGGAYNMNEGFTSGSLTATVRCFGSVQRSDMLQSGALANSATGGMALLGVGNVIAANNLGTVADKSLVYKSQSAAGLGAFISRESHY